MAEKKLAGPAVRIIGSRELHQKLPTIMKELEHNDARYVLTIHGRPKAVLVGASTYLELVQGTQHPSETIIGLQLSAMLGTSLDQRSVPEFNRREMTNLDSKP